MRLNNAILYTEELTKYDAIGEVETEYLSDDLYDNAAQINSPDYDYNGAIAEYEDAMDYVCFSLKGVRVG